MGANKIYLQVDFQSDDADAQIKKLNQEIAGVGDASESASKKSSQAFGSISLSVEETQRAVFGLGEAIASLAIVRLGMDMAQSADKINRLQISLETLTGSAKGARDMISAMRDVAAHSPFAFEELLTGAQRMKAFGMQASRIPASMKAISDAAAGLGGGVEMIEEITRALNLMYAKNEAGSRELLRGGLLKTGAPIFQMIQEGLKKSTGTDFSQDDIRKMIDTHKLVGRKLADALLEGMQERYSGAGEKVLGLVTSQLTKLTDEAQALAVVINGDLAPTLAGWIQQLQSLLKWFEQLSPATRWLIETVLELAAAVAILELGLKGLNLIFGSGVLVAGLNAVAFAFNVIAPAIAEVVAAGGGLAGVVTAMGLIASSPALAGLRMWASGFLLLAAAMAGWWAGGQILDWLEQYRAKAEGVFDPSRTDIFSRAARAIGNALTDQVDKTRVAAEGMKDAAESALFVNAKLRAQAATDAPFVLHSLPKLNASATVDAIKEQNDQIIAAIRDARKQVDEASIKADEAALERLDQMTKDALEQAKAHALGGIAAVQHETQKLLDAIYKVKHPYGEPLPSMAVIESRVPEINALKTQTVITEALKKGNTERLALERKATEEGLADMKKASELEVELAKQTADESLAARARALTRGYDVLVANEVKIRAAMQASTEAQMNDALAAKREELTRGGFKPGDAVYELELATVRTTFRQLSEKQDLESYERIAKYRVDLEKQVISDTQQLNAQAFQLQNQNQLDRAQRAGDLLKAMVDAVPAQTEEQKTAQAQAAAKAEIDAANLVYTTQLQIDQALYNDRLAALQEYLAASLIDYGQYTQAVMAMDRLQIQERQKLDQDRLFLTQRLELDAIKKHNEAVIADQKEVYDQIKSGIDKVWDAMTSRAGTFAQRIGNMLKAAFMDAAKSIVTSHAAAALTGAFGKGKVEFGGGGLRQLLGKEPVFGQDKMQEAGHLGDVTTISAGGYQVVPTWVMNQPPGQQVTQNIQVSNPKQAATIMALPGAAGVALAIPSGAASAAPGGTVSAVSSTFEGVSTGPEVIRALTSSGGGGGFSSGVSSGAFQPQFAGLPANGMSLASLIPGLGGSAAPGGSSGGGGIMGTISSVAKLTGGGGLSKMLGIAGPGGGGTLNLLPGSMIPGLGLGAAVAGLMGARKLGTDNGPAGLAGGAALGAFSGLLAAGSLAALFPSVFVPLLAAGPAGWIAAAGIGAAVGLSSLFIKSADQKVQQKVKAAYGVNITNKNIRMQIVQIAQQKYGGNLNVAIASPEVQQLVRMYAISTGQNPMGMPRPMYSATLTESGAGGVNLLPVYQSGQVVANPYSGTTTTQYNQMASEVEMFNGNPLAQGVNSVIASNPGTIAAANAAALNSGNSRDSQAQALLEPLTVMS